jgi:hypothetical protein
MGIKQPEQYYNEQYKNKQQLWNTKINILNLPTQYLQKQG